MLSFNYLITIHQNLTKNNIIVFLSTLKQLNKEDKLRLKIKSYKIIFSGHYYIFNYDNY